MQEVTAGRNSRRGFKTQFLVGQSRVPLNVCKKCKNAVLSKVSLI